MNLITGYAGEAHVTSFEDALRNAALMQNGGKYVIKNYGDGLAAEKLSNTSIRIGDGAAINQGRIFKNDTAEDLTISAGIAGTKRCDIIVARYEKNTSTNVETVTLEVIEGVSGSSYDVPPYYNNELLETESAVDDLLLYEVHIDGTTIDEIIPRFKPWYLDTGWIEDEAEEVGVSYYSAPGVKNIKPRFRIVGNHVFFEMEIYVTDDFSFEIPAEYIKESTQQQQGTRKRAFIAQKRSGNDLLTEITLDGQDLYSSTSGTISSYFAAALYLDWFLD